MEAGEVVSRGRFGEVRVKAGSSRAAYLVSSFSIGTLLRDLVLGNGVGDVSTGVSARVVSMGLFAIGMLKEAEDGVIGSSLDQLIGVDVLAEGHGGWLLFSWCW